MSEQKTVMNAMIFFICIFSAALIEASTERPKIAVVLSGGGARGFAHVGVLRYFEEHHIPIDKIAGTSMGGLVGGMYATGMTSDELQQMIDRIDWHELFRPLPAFETLSFRRKEDRRLFPNSFELGLKGGLKFPPGVNPGHAIGLLLNRYTYQYSDINNFDELPIPFRCIATEMVEARQVVLSDGSLSTAMQATMAIPGVFYPIDIDGKLYLSDGGLLNNIPTDVAEQMGADVIIAVDIGTPLGKRESLDRLSGVLNQAISIATNQNIRENLDAKLHPKLKVVIAPDLKQYTTFSFANSQEIMKLGYQGAEQKASELLPYALNDQDWETYIREKQSRIKKQIDAPIPQFVKVTGTDESAGKTIQHSLQSHVGTHVDPDSLDKDLSKIWGRGRYAGLGYELTRESENTGLLIRTRRKGYAPPFLNVGLELNNTQTDVFDFNLRARITLMDVMQEGAEWRFDGSIGSEISLGAEYYKLLGSSRLFVAPHGAYDRTKSGVFFKGDELGEYQLETADLGADFGLNLSSTSELRVGYDFGHQKGTVRVGDPGLPEGSGKFSKAIVRWIYDGADSAIVPTRGFIVNSRLEWNFDVPITEGSDADEEFPQASARGSVFVPFSGTKNTLFFIGEGGTTFDKSAPGLNKLRLGGLLRVSAAARNEFLGDHLLYGSMGYLRTLGHMPLLLGEKISAGLWYEVGSAYDDSDSKDAHHSVSVALIAETFLGPILIGGSFGDEGRKNFFFAIGKIF